MYAQRLEWLEGEIHHDSNSIRSCVDRPNASYSAAARSASWRWLSALRSLCMACRPGCAEVEEVEEEEEE